MSNICRHYILYDEFNINSEPRLEHRQSLERLYQYLFIQTNINYLKEVTQRELYRYLLYHSEHKFTKLSFQQAIKDLKVFVSHYNVMTGKKIQLDLSLNNFYLWCLL